MGKQEEAGTLQAFLIDSSNNTVSDSVEDKASI